MLNPPPKLISPSPPKKASWGEGLNKYFYKKKCQDLNRTVKHLKSQKNIDRIVKDRLLARGMTLNMANMYVKGRKFGRNINIQDVVFAATVKGLSPKTYRYIRKRKLI